MISWHCIVWYFTFWPIIILSIFCKSCQIWINVCFFGFFLHVVQKFPAPFIEKMIFLYCISFTLFRKINNIGVGLVMDTVFPPKTYSDNIVFYVENSERSIKQLLELQSEFTRVAGYQVNVKKKKNQLYIHILCY